MTILDMARSQVAKARSSLISGTKKRAGSAHVDVAKMADLRQQQALPHDPEDAEEYQRCLEFLEQKCTAKWKAFCVAVDLQRSIEVKGW